MKHPLKALAAAGLLFLTGCAAPNQVQSVDTVADSMPLEYAEQFSVDFREDGCSVIHIGEDSFLLVPENADIPEHGNMAVIQQPLDSIYVAATAAMDLFDAAGGLDSVLLTSTNRSGWALPDIAAAMDAGDLTFIGKYSAPDYEALLETECDLAVENTMIYHSPAVKEQIESLGIPVLVERSSYETHPLGRMEWIKLYGLLLDKYDEAVQYFDTKTAAFRALTLPDIPEEDRPRCAFFSITSNGAVNIRKPGDYISRMIELAGGRYLFNAEDLNVDENALSTMNIQMEAFYESAKDADILIYNSTIEGRLDNIAQLLEKSSLFADFRAVQENRVWCTEQNMFQQTTGAADMMTDLNKILTGQADETDDLTYLHRLRP